MLEVPPVVLASVGEVAAKLEDAADHVRIGALKGLSRFKPEEVVPFLDKVVGRLQSDTEMRVRLAAVELLGKLGHHAAPRAEALESALHAPQAVLRQMAARALGRVSAGRSAEKLADLLEDGDPEVRRIAGKALAALGPVEAGAAVASKLKHPQKEVRAEAQHSLLRMKTLHAATRSAKQSMGGVSQTADEATETLALHLGPVLGHPNPEVRFAATEVLQKIRPEDSPGATAATCHAARLEDLVEEVRVASVLSLGDLGPHAQPYGAKLARRCVDEAEPVRRAAVEALTKLGPEHGVEAAPVLGELLGHHLETVRRAAFASLAALGEAAHTYRVERGLAHLTDSSPSLRCGAVEALVEIGLEEGLGDKETAALLTLFIDRHWCVRLAVAKAIKSFGEGTPMREKGLKPLQALAIDGDWRVAREAKSALKQYSGSPPSPSAAGVPAGAAVAAA